MEGRAAGAQNSKGLALPSDARRTQTSRIPTISRRQGAQPSQKVQCACYIHGLIMPQIYKGMRQS